MNKKLLTLAISVVLMSGVASSSELEPPETSPDILTVTDHGSYSDSEEEEDSGDDIDQGDEDLPELGAAMAGKEGEEMLINASIAGGLSVGGFFTEEVSLEDEVSVRGLIVVDPAHVGQLADVVVFAAYMPLDYSLSKPVYFMLDENLGIYVWDENPASLVPFMKVAADASEISVNMYQGQFILPGILNIHFGYRLQDGTLVTNGETIDVYIISDDSF